MNALTLRSLVIASVLLAASACRSTADGPTPAVPATAESTPGALAAKPQSATPTSTTTPAEVGQPAPAFELKDLDGKTVKLADLQGKIVVLEWFNAGCPFVNAAHTKGSLVDAAKRASASGVVWLSISSSGPGKQGNGVDANRAGAAKFGMTNPILIDESGAVGHAYGATNTPHLFVVDGKGTLVYAGAVDNSPDGDCQSPEGGHLVRYVDAALGDLAAGRPVATPRTRAYGCSVKYVK
jgi:peroxiredoxin